MLQINKILALLLIGLFSNVKSDQQINVKTNYLILKNESLNLLSSTKLDDLFSKYSNNNQIMTLSQLKNFFHHLIDMFSSTTSSNDNKDHDHNNDHHPHDHDHDHDIKMPSNIKIDQKVECLKEKLNHIEEFLKLDDNFDNINKVKFNKLTGIIKVDIDYCFPNITESMPKSKNVYKTDHWTFAFLSAFLISLIGLLCYLVVPLLNTYCFNHMFQFLVALAVGSLSGDSLLHLIPHAFDQHGHGDDDFDSHDHKSGVYKGLGAIIGIYVFFVIEKIMQMRRARKEKRHKLSELEADSGKFNQNEKLLINPNDPYLNNILTNSAYNVIKRKKEDEEPGIEEPLFSKSQLQISHQVIQVEPQVNDQYVIHANKDLKYISQYLPNNKCDINVAHHDHEDEKEHLHKHRNEIKSDLISPTISTAKTTISTDSTDTQTKLLEDGQASNSTIDNSCVCTTTSTLPSTTKSEQSPSSNLNNKVEVKKSFNNHSHSHKHGHSHGHIYKSSREKAHHDHHKKHEKEIRDIKLIAWMVLMGDGLHNFADGLAIGASFATSLTTGFGTAIAVLCHELPHEIGDFAVLRRAGVSLKRALVFNAVSGVLCMIGVLVGLLIGGNEALSNWTFLFIAGTFLYISLVDMIPELSENKEDDSISNFAIQNLGIIVGIGIMLAIALLENEIIKIFK